MISVKPRSRSREDRAGDPLDGLVNLFDLGIVLSVAFLLAALSSLHLGSAITRHGLHATPARAIYIQRGQTVAPLPKPGKRTMAAGSRPASSTGSPTASSCTSSRRHRAATEWAICGQSCVRPFP